MAAINLPSLQSANLSKLLIKLLWILLILGGVSVVFALIGLVLPYDSGSLLVGAIASLDALQAVAGVVLNLVVIVMALVWLHKVHQDLQSLYGAYPITPGGAIARFMIPFYNIWGIGNTLGTMASHFKADLPTQTDGRTLSSFIPWLYATLILSNVLNRIALQQTLEGASSSAGLLLGAAVVDTALTFVQLQIAQAVTSAVRSKALSSPAVQGF